MYPVYRWFYNLMGFTRSQTNGFLIFMPLLALILFSKPLYLTWRPTPTMGNPDDARKLDSLVAMWPVVPTPDSMDVHQSLMLPARIDPNTASRTDLIRIGLPEMLAGRIISYRKKGGRFYSGYDLLKIYGIDSIMLTNIRPRIALPFSKSKREEWRNRSEYTSRVEVRPRLLFDLNGADTAMLKKVRGIGEKLALRIVKYRDVLGGFVGVHQLNEIYRLDTAVIRELKKVSFIAPDFTPQKLDVNIDDEKILAAHPYLAPGEAKAIVAYRFQHGKFNSLDDLAQVKALDSLTRKRILPYLEISKY